MLNYFCTLPIMMLIVFMLLRTWIFVNVNTVIYHAVAEATFVFIPVNIKVYWYRLQDIFSSGLYCV